MAKHLFFLLVIGTMLGLSAGKDWLWSAGGYVDSTYTTTNAIAFYITCDIPNVWTQYGGMPAQRAQFGSGVFADGTVIFASGNTKTGRTSATETFLLDADAAPVSRQAFPSNYIHSPTADTYQECLYMSVRTTAQGSLFINLVKFCRSNLQWTAMPGTILARDRRGGTAVTFNQYLYFFDGFDADGVVERLSVSPAGVASVEVLNSNRQQLGINYGCGVRFKDSIILIGGNDASGTPQSRVDRYDPVGNAWYPMPSLSNPRVSAGCAVANGKIYVSGGSSTSGFINSVEVFDPAVNYWAEVSNRPIYPGVAGLAGSALLSVNRFPTTLFMQTYSDSSCRTNLALGKQVNVTQPSEPQLCFSNGGSYFKAISPQSGPYLYGQVQVLAYSDSACQTNVGSFTAVVNQCIVNAQNGGPVKSWVLSTVKG